MNKPLRINPKERELLKKELESRIAALFSSGEELEDLKKLLESCSESAYAEVE